MSDELKRKQQKQPLLQNTMLPPQTECRQF